MRKSAPLFCALLLSLSARRAWIEILFVPRFEPAAAGAAVHIGGGQAIPDIQAGVFFVAQDVVQAVFAEWLPPAGYIAPSVKGIYNFSVARSLLVQVKNQLHRLSLPRNNGILACRFIHRIAQRRRATCGSCCKGVFAQTFGNLLRQVGAVPLVDGLGYIAHELALRSGVKVFRRGNDLNALPAQLHFDHRLLIRVAEKAVQLVHDDVLHPGGSCIGQHALEFRAFPPAAAVAMVLIDLYQLIPCRGGKGDDCTLLGFQRFLTLLIGRFTAIAKSPRGLHWRRNCGNHKLLLLLYRSRGFY